LLPRLPQKAAASVLAFLGDRAGAACVPPADPLRYNRIGCVYFLKASERVGVLPQLLADLHRRRKLQKQLKKDATCAIERANADARQLAMYARCCTASPRCALCAPPDSHAVFCFACSRAASFR